MSSITTEYRGYSISYSENADEWNCYDCGVSHASLSKVKAKIDALHLKLRKTSSVECLFLGEGYGRAGVTHATMIDYMGPEYTSGRWPEKEKTLVGHKVAAMHRDARKDRPTRQTGRLENYAPDTPEVREAVAAWVQAEREEEEARQRKEKARNAIPRMTLEMIDGLIKAASAKIEEDAPAPERTKVVSQASGQDREEQ